MTSWLPGSHSRCLSCSWKQLKEHLNSGTSRRLLVTRQVSQEHLLAGVSMSWPRTRPFPPEMRTGLTRTSCCCVGTAGRSRWGDPLCKAALGDGERCCLGTGLCGRTPGVSEPPSGWRKGLISGQAPKPDKSAREGHTGSFSPPAPWGSLCRAGPGAAPC